MTKIGSGIIISECGQDSAVEIPQGTQRCRTIIGSGIFDLDSDVLYDISPNANYVASGFIASFTYGESLVLGDFVCIRGNNSVWKASYDDVVFSRVMGISLIDASYGSHNVLLSGFLRFNSWSWSLDVDKRIVYIGLNGVGTQIQPSGTDNAIQTIATVINTNTLFFNPSLDYMTHI